MMRYLFVSLVFLLLQGCNSNNLPYPQNQHLPGPFHFDGQWQEIRFDPALEINREGYQGLHLLVSRALYESHVSDRWPNQASLQRTDGVLVLPEVVLVGDNGQEVVLTVTAFYYPPEDMSMTLGFSSYIPDKGPQDFPREIQSFMAARIRSNEPLDVTQLRWQVDNHPDYYVCGGRQCPWWYRWLE